MNKTNFVVVLFLSMLFSSQFSAYADDGNDDDMITIQADNVAIVESPIQIDLTSKDVEVITTAKNSDGVEKPTAVLVTDHQTGKRMLVGLGKDPKEAAVFLNVAARVKFPEIFGARVSVEFYRLVEAGIDVGFGFIYNDLGFFVNVYPLFKTPAKGLYVGFRSQAEGIYLIFGTASGLRQEAVIGYRFENDDKRSFFFFEVGFGRQVGPLQTNFLGYTSTATNELPLPVVAIGGGIKLFHKKN